jgi:hypothetical protein
MVNYEIKVEFVHGDNYYGISLNGELVAGAQSYEDADVAAYQIEKQQKGEN